MCISIMNIFLCFYKYQNRLIFSKKRGIIFEHENASNNWIMYKFFIELIFLSVHPSPFIMSLTFTQRNYELKQTITYFYNDILIIIIFIQVPYQIYEMFNSTKYNSPRIQRINMIFSNQNLKNSMPIKNYIANHPIIFMIISFIFSVLYFSSFILIVERESSKKGDKKLERWDQAIWYVVVTMTTIGYGDIVSKTLIARILVMVLVIWGNFWDSIFLSSIYPYILQNIREKKAYNLFNRISIKKQIREISSEIIKKFLKVVVLDKKKGLGNKKKIIAVNNQLFHLLRKKRQLNNRMVFAVHETFYFIDDMLLDLEILTNQSEDHLFKVERIFKNIQKILKISSKKKDIFKGSIKHRYAILKTEANKIYIESEKNKKRKTKKFKKESSEEVVEELPDLDLVTIQSVESGEEEKYINFYKTLQIQNPVLKEKNNKENLHETLSKFLKNK